MSIKYVYFDFFNTLVTSPQSVDWDNVFQDINYSLSLQEREELKRQFLLVYTNMQWKANITAIEFSMDEVTAKLFNTIGKYPEDLFINFAKAYMDNWYCNVDIFPDTRDTIAELSKQYKIGIISNTHDVTIVPRLLEKFSLHHYFNQVVLSIAVQYRKPDRRIFYAATGPTYTPGEWCFIGDHAVQDIRGAEAAGFFSVQICRDKKHIESLGDARIHSLTELFTILDKRKDVR